MNESRFRILAVLLIIIIVLLLGILITLLTIRQPIGTNAQQTNGAISREMLTVTWIVGETGTALYETQKAAQTRMVDATLTAISAYNQVVGLTRTALSKAATAALATYAATTRTPTP